MIELLEGDKNIKNRLRINVLMSTYNGEKYLEQQIDSILAQKGNFNVRLWVRDDGSSDDTKRILEEYAASSKLIWYQGNNLHTAKSFLTLLQKCEEGDYYAFADQDDVWYEDKLLRAIEKLERKKLKNNALVYFSNADLVDDNLSDWNRVVYRNIPSTDIYTILSVSNVLGCTMVFNNVLAELIRTRRIPSNIIMHDSYLTKVCVAVGGEIIYDSKPSMKYRQHSNNVIGIKKGKLKLVSERIKLIFEKEDIGIDLQIKEIYDNYESILTSEKKDILNLFVNYKKNVFSRLLLACTKKTKYISFNMSVSIRLSILLGNR